MTDSKLDSIIKKLKASLISNTAEVEIIDFIKEQRQDYLDMFTKSDQYLSRAIQAEGDLAVAKLLLADQEIELRRAETRITDMCAVIGCARNTLKQAAKELNNIEVPY